MTIPPLQSLVLLAVTMFLMDESTSDRTSTCIHILVGAPASKVDIPVVQLQLDISGSVSEVPPNNHAVGMSVCRNGGNVKKLAAVVLNTGEKDQGQFVGVLVDKGKNPGGGYNVALIRFDLEH